MWYDLSLVSGYVYRWMLWSLGLTVEGKGALLDWVEPTIKAGKKDLCNAAAKDLLDKKPQKLCMTHGVISPEPVVDKLKSALDWVGPLKPR